jgi:hypothetical protein
MLDEEVNYETIDEVKSIKKKRTNQEINDLFICVSPDSFYIFKESQRVGRSLSDLISRKEYLEKISFGEISDIVFPSLKKITKKIKDKEKGIPFRILTNTEEYWVWVSEKSFWISRKLFEDTLYIKENVRL